MTDRRGRQTPTQSVVLPYSETRGPEAVTLYNKTGRTAQEWQELLLYDILAVNGDGLWTHQKFGYSVPRRNGKNEVLTMRELYGLTRGEKICHTAHRTTTSHSAWERLRELLALAGYVELGRRKKDEADPPNGFRTSKQFGLEQINLAEGGSIVFRTRTENGGLGEGFDLLVIDEAQEYTEGQESALIYTVSDSANPQTILCGTPPTMTSAGTVFQTLRTDALAGSTIDTGWAEWSVEHQPQDINDRELWYETNPSLGTVLTERKILMEIRQDTLDFVIQRLGYWHSYSLKSAISAAEWGELKCPALPKLTGKLSVGIKYGHDGDNVSLSIAVRTADQRIFVESIDCRPIRAGNDWILSFLRRADVERVVIDGAGGQQNLADAMKESRLKPTVCLPTVKEVISANALFETALTAREICHMGQPSLVQSVTNCEHRAIGSNGGRGYRSIKDGVDVSLMESMILAYWACATGKQKPKQRVSY
ncbi:MAG: terminase [Candidatus Onthomonas sp.]